MGDRFYSGQSRFDKGFYITGLKETLDAFREVADEIGDKRATSRFLLPALKQAFQPVFIAARMLSPRDTQQLAQSVELRVKRPTAKDKKSIYVNQGDTVIAKVETKPIAAKHKKEAKELSKELSGYKIKLNKKKFYESRGYFYDARAIANEFGTANRPAKPFLRPALESQAQNVVAILSMIIDQKIKQYRSKTVK